MTFSPFTSVTRWLLVVIGCAVLATAQPMSAAAPDAVATPAERPSDKIIYPKGSAEKPAEAPAPKTSNTGGSYTLVLAVLLAAAGGWVMLKRRQGAPIAARGTRKLQLEETRPLGNRQYLVVANYDGKKFLLGVTTGQIQMLTALEDGAAVEEKSS